MAKKQNTPAKSKDAVYWKASIALSAINVLIMLYQLYLTKKQTYNV